MHFRSFWIRYTGVFITLGLLGSYIGLDQLGNHYPPALPYVHALENVFWGVIISVGVLLAVGGILDGPTGKRFIGRFSRLQWLQDCNHWADAKYDRARAARYRNAAVHGDARAQWTLGGMCEQGVGVVQDYNEALHWYRMAADQGFRRAQLRLGFMYLHGSGGEENRGEALRWFHGGRGYG
jgi:cobalamin biosynthesis protein CobT